MKTSRTFRYVSTTVGMAAACLLLYGHLVTLHANTPHKCPKHGGKSAMCEHVSQADDLHEPGQQSENMKKRAKNKDIADIVGCGCFWDCLMSGSF